VKNKLLFFLLSVVLLCSILNVVLAEEECPRCHGTGKIRTTGPCPTCGGSGVLEPKITRKSTFAWGSEPPAKLATFVAGLFENEEDVGTYGVATAEMKTTATYTNTSSRIYFPPHEVVNITITIKEIKFENYWTYSIYLSEVDSVTCPDCDEGEYGSILIDCPYCNGTGYVTEGAGGGTGGLGGGIDFLVVGGAVGGVAAAAAVATAAVVVVRRKRVSEENLRKISTTEFQSWVVQRLSGKASSPKDSYRGIDGFTGEGYPIQAKQSGDVGRNDIERFVTAMGQSKAKKGIIVAFSFANDAYMGKVRAKVHYNREIELVRVKELIESSHRTL
jgi:hypothetical protein